MLTVLVAAAVLVWPSHGRRPSRWRHRRRWRGLAACMGRLAGPLVRAVVGVSQPQAQISERGLLALLEGLAAALRAGLPPPTALAHLLTTLALSGSRSCPSRRPAWLFSGARRVRAAMAEVVAAGAVLPGTVSSGAVLPGAVLPGTVSSGAVLPGAVATEAEGPVGASWASEEALLRRLLASATVGERLEPVWRAEAQSSRSVALLAVADGWALSEQHGAPLVQVLDALVGALRDSARARAAVETALAGPRATATLLGVLPLGGLVLGELVGVHPVGVLVGTSAGRVCALSGALATALGQWWMRRLVAVAA